MQKIGRNFLPCRNRCAKMTGCLSSVLWINFLPGFLLIFCFFYGLSSLSNNHAFGADNPPGKVIELPDAPKAQVPISRPQEGDSKKDSGSDDLQRLRGERQKREGETNPKPPTPSERQHNALVLESLKDRPLTLMFEVSLIYPKIIVTGVRKSYVADMSSHFQVVTRMFPSLPATDLQLWYGLRLAPFAGYGVYKGVPGRFGFTYLGPIIGVGNLVQRYGERPSSASEGETDTKAARQIDHGESAVASNEGIVRWGYLWTLGIAAQSRVGYATRYDESVDDDFNSKGFAMDAPGVWSEIRLLSVHYGALGYNAFIGGQAGKGKQFYWVGMGLAGWY